VYVVVVIYGCAIILRGKGTPSAFEMDGSIFLSATAYPLVWG